MSHIEFLEQLLTRSKNDQLNNDEKLLILELEWKLQFLSKEKKIDETDLWSCLSLGFIIRDQLLKNSSNS